MGMAVTKSGTQTPVMRTPLQGPTPVPARPPPIEHNREMFAEVRLLARLIVAADEHDGHLSVREVDTLLGVSAEMPPRSPDPTTTSTVQPGRTGEGPWAESPAPATVTLGTSADSPSLNSAPDQ